MSGKAGPGSGETGPRPSPGRAGQGEVTPIDPVQTPRPGSRTGSCSQSRKFGRSSGQRHIAN